MSGNFKFALASLVLVAAAALPAQADPIIINGDFSVFVPTNGSGGGWTSANISGVGHQDTGGNPGGHFILNASGELATDPTIFQTVSGFTVGQTYRLTGDYASFASGSGNPNALSFAVDINGVNVAVFGRPGAEGVFGVFSVDFVASAVDQLIAFRAEINGDDSSFRIDNITVRQVGGQPGAVPEPATVLLLGTGLAGVVVRARRRRRAG